MRFNRAPGSADPLLAPLIIAVIAVMGLTGFGLWSYMQYQDYRDRAQEKIDEAVVEAKEAQQKELEAEFIEREKEPLDTYTGPRSLGSVRVRFPKTWSAYVIEDADSEQALNAYFHPQYVHSVESETRHALRLEVLSQPYEEQVSEYEEDIEGGDLRSRAIKASGETGIRLDGKIDEDVVGTMVIFPLNDKTLRVWTESTSFRNDFEKIVLKSLKFDP